MRTSIVPSGIVGMQFSNSPMVCPLTVTALIDDPSSLFRNT